ncbi:N-acetylneuraminate synthase [Candidatus Termititenax persephonae]|uniref:N-acetylneuraminate synthase n=1 Tax=Candidatus Termititenax persephonae TaxID=2218525 RepID=A0A388TI73_9BACT|nr:N-acetylneuraminate synthase [Candidatus Termititenax persephonae]
MPMPARELYIGQRKVSRDARTYFIADIAANHDGDLGRAKELIYLAKEAGADCAKFQHFLAGKIVSDFGFKNLSTAQSHQAKWKKSVFEIYQEYECKREWTEILAETCGQAGLEFMTTPYDYAAIEQVDKHVRAYKIGSGDITWLEFLEQIARRNKPILLATGASNLLEVKKAVMVIEKYAVPIVLMQCNTNYTASLDNFKHINLNVLRTYKKEFPEVILGLSDHTPGCTTVLGAVALGARVIEKHFTDNNMRTGPDHHFAMNPKTWREMVDRTRELEFALGDGVKRVEENEKETVVIQRRCLRLKVDKKIGDKLAAEDLEMLRPAPLNAYQPAELNEVVDKKLIVAKQKGDCLRQGELSA